MKNRTLPRVLALALAIVSMPAVAFAASNSNFTQTINTGTLTTDILDASRNSVASPAVAMSAKSFSFSCYSGGTASTGTFGTNTERIYVSNGDAADNGFTLTVAATSGASATWANTGATQKFDFNDSSGAPAGCSDGADAGGDTFAGQMTINPAAGSLTTDCVSCSLTGVSLGSSAAFNQGTVDNITLINAGSTSNDIWRGYLANASISQTVPAEQTPDSYTLNLTLTATAQ
jgi:hypothetical protein